MTSESNEKLRTARAAADRRRSKCFLISAAVAATAIGGCLILVAVAGHDARKDGGGGGGGRDAAAAGLFAAFSHEIEIDDATSRPAQASLLPNENDSAAAAAALRFFDLVESESLPPPLPKDVYPVTTAYEESTVVVRAPWFRRPDPTPRCVAAARTGRRRGTGGCCASADVAISLSQDDLRPINTMDGDDLADVRLRGFRQLKATERYVMRGFRKAVVNLTHHASDLTADLAPCLQSGTIINVDMFPTLLDQFLKEIRPKMTKPYVLITGGTDNASPPSEEYVKTVLDGDALLIRWYGTNGHPSALGHAKFVPMPLGLARDYVPQQPELAALHRVRGGANPFAGGRDAKKRWTDAPELFGDDVTDTSRSLFVNFGMSKSKKTTHRAGPFRMACDGRTDDAPTTEEKSVSCVNGTTFPLRTVYSAASRYLFALSPPGRGTDCYRTYELLLLGVIPIVWHHPMYDGELLNGLPHLQLTGLNYTQHDLLTLMREYVRSDDFARENFAGWDRLFMKYWRRRVLDDAGRTKDIMTDEGGNEYYRAFAYH